MVALLFPALAMGVDRPEEELCRRVEVQIDNPWVHQLAWDQAGDQLFMPSVREGAVHVIDSRGLLARSLRAPGAGSLEWNKVVHFLPWDGGYLLLNARKAVLLNSAFEPYRGHSFRQPKRPPGQVRQLFAPNLAVAENGDVYFYGDVEREAWQTGYFLWNADSDDLSVEDLESSESKDEQQRAFALATLQLVAVVGGDGYFLTHQEGLAVAAAGPPWAELSAFPEGYDRLPPVSLGAPYQGFVKVMGILEESPVAVGLYGYGNLLYVLTREPLGSGSTRWKVHLLDPRKDSIVSVKTLPTTAPWILLAPGARRWAILEKSSFDPEIPAQEITSLLLVSSQVFDPDAKNPVPRAAECVDAGSLSL